MPSTSYGVPSDTHVTKQKSRIRETKNLSTDEDSRTDTIFERLSDLSQNYRYIFFLRGCVIFLNKKNLNKKNHEKLQKKLRLGLSWQNLDKNICCPFFKCSLKFWAHALHPELNKVWYTDFVKFRLQSMSSKVEQAYKKRPNFP